jgi:hypothetical protein
MKFALASVLFEVMVSILFANEIFGCPNYYYFLKKIK